MKQEEFSFSKGNSYWLLGLLAFSILLWMGAFYFSSHCVDDAGIFFQYAKNLASGCGLSYHPDFSPVEGFSSWLWVAVLSFFYLLGIQDLIRVSFFLGMGFLFLTGLLVWKEGFRNPWSGVCFLLFLLNPVVLYWSVCGMENALYGFLLVFSFFTLKRNRDFLFYLGIFLLFFTRIEAFLFVFVLSFFHRNRKNLLIFFVFLLLIQSAIRFFYFGSVFPNTLIAKMGLIHSLDFRENLVLGWRYYSSFFVEFFRFSFFGIFLIAYAAFRKQWMIVVFLLTHVLFLLLSGGDWMRGWRFLSPFLPFYFYLAVMALWDFVSRFRELLPVGLILLLNLGIFFIWRWKPHFEKLNHPYMEISVRMERGAQFEKLAREKGIENPVSLLDVDVGGTAWGSDLKVYDMVGLTNSRIARAIDKKEAVQAFIKENKPHFIHSHGFWSDQFGLPSFFYLKENYLPAFSLNQDAYFDKNLGCDLIRRDLMFNGGKKP